MCSRSPLDISAHYHSSKPFTRWWWFSGPITEREIARQLEWIRDNGFGGVEIAWVYPLPESEAGPRWLSPEWSEKVAYAKRFCDRIGLGCDFTFGTMWPFGGSIVPKEDALQVYGGLSKQRLRASWETPFESAPGHILNHLDRHALSRYSDVMGAALKEALKGSSSALFCDSWEVETEKIWTGGFGDAFRDRYGYSIEEYMDDLDEHPDVRYDYRKLVAAYVLDGFYRPFDAICHDLGAASRVQCHGAPTDLLAAYASVDIPETEAILFEPHFARIAASAAALAGKPIVSSETFTCLYGWRPRPGPAPYIRQEQVADMKLLVDSLFAHGVNHVIWHGMPYNPEGCENEFYATVHVGPDSPFADEIRPFNTYMEKVCSFMRRGKPYADLAVYLPVEDAWMANELPQGEYSPDARYFWEFRYSRIPAALKGHHPLWISGHFLKDAEVVGGKLRVGDCRFSALYIDAGWIDEEVLTDLLRLARLGLPICLRRQPSQPGKNKSESYAAGLSELISLPRIVRDFDKLPLKPPLVKGELIPDFWCRIDGDTALIFFANPDSMDVHYPMTYGQSYAVDTLQVPLVITFGGRSVEITLIFEPYRSLLVEIPAKGAPRLHDIAFCPGIPSTQP